MQQFITPDKFKNPFKRKACFTKKVDDVNKPSPEIIPTLLAYAAALHVFKTKSVGDIAILMN